MFLTNIISEKNIFNILQIPGSSDDVCKKTIEYYQSLVDDPTSLPATKELSKAFVHHLTRYYSMSNLENDSLRQALPHLSESAIFMESKSSTDMDIESSGRIKSFYSLFQKLVYKLYECAANGTSLTDESILFDVYATRDVFYPRHDMKFNPEAFYKLSYKTIYEYMEYIDALNKNDSKYGFVEQSEKTLRDLERPEIITYDSTEIIIPKKDFTGYLLESKNISDGFRYLSNLPNDIPVSQIKDFVLELKECDLQNDDLSKLGIYNYIDYQTKQEHQCALRNYFESIFLKRLETVINNISKDKNNKPDILKDYYSFPTEDFIEKYGTYFTKYDIDCCNFVNYISSYINTKTILDTTTLPKFQNREFVRDLSNSLGNTKELHQYHIRNKLEEIKNIDLESFEQNFSEASKINRYSKCFKDYMRNPKANGYQSFHIIVRTPFGHYEKQIRTASQNAYAEFGLASHSKNYKPDEKANFHRIKVPKYLSPRRNVNGDIILPIELGVLPFEQCVHSFYGTPFSYFAKGKTFNELKSQFATQEEFDEAILALSPVVKENTFIKSLRNKFSSKPIMADNYVNQTPITPITPITSQTCDIPSDISVYPGDNSTTDNFSTDDSDPHDNR